jgi:serine O-acetyltransferase
MDKHTQPDESSDSLAWLEDVLSQVSSALEHRRCASVLRLPDGGDLPCQESIYELLAELLCLLLPGCPGSADHQAHGDTRSHLDHISRALHVQILKALRYGCDDAACPDSCDCHTRAQSITAAFLNNLTEIDAVLSEDLKAAYEGDPAAKSTVEVVMSYPGIIAVAVHRIAHELYKQKVPLISRIMSEWAHSRTGIDIHPGATIGPGFFIDHGTGVVVGETCQIGKRVKLYQGVTLGALSFEQNEDGSLVKGIKRHPDVEDHVTIYAGATILGGNTRIGEGSEIGGNVWLTQSVPPWSKVYNQTPSPKIRTAQSNPLSKEEES